MSLPVCSEAVAEFDLESLARRLAAADERLVVWKGGRDLAAQGDLDCAAPRDAWPSLEAAFETWADDRGLAATVACEHPLGMLVLVGCGGAAGPRLVQVDLVDTMLVHGAPAWTAADALAAALRAKGVSYTSPGAEGVLRRLADTSDRGALALAAGDPKGAARVATRLGVRGRLAGGGAVTGLLLEALLYLRPFLHPRWLARARTSDHARENCAVLQALRNQRTVPGDVEAWLDDVARSHPVRRLEVAQ